MAAVLKSLSLSLAVTAGFSLLVGASVLVAPGRAQEQSPDAPVEADVSPGLVEETLIARGNELLEAGDFASARLLYQAAANQGSGRAAMLTGVTFDPRYRELAGISGPEDSARLARRWYALAMRRGDTEARRNDLELVQWLKDQNIDPDAVVEGDTEMEAKAKPHPESALQSADDTASAFVDTPAPSPAARPAAQSPDTSPASLNQVTPTPLARPDIHSYLSESTPAPRPSIGTAAPQGPAEVGEGDAEPTSAETSVEPSEGAPTGASMDPSIPATTVDARVVRALLTSAIEDREPVDRLAPSIRVSDGRIERILFFSEVRDLAGQTLSHRWERQGQTMADVSFAIGSRSWRMHSSKRVTPAMTGAWRVVVVDGSGAELASVPFILE